MWCFIKVSCEVPGGVGPTRGDYAVERVYRGQCQNLWLEAVDGHRPASWTRAPCVGKTVVCEELVATIFCLSVIPSMRYLRAKAPQRGDFDMKLGMHVPKPRMCIHGIPLRNPIRQHVAAIVVENTHQMWA